MGTEFTNLPVNELRIKINNISNLNDNEKLEIVEHYISIKKELQKKFYSNLFRRIQLKLLIGLCFVLFVSPLMTLTFSILGESSISSYILSLVIFLVPFYILSKMEFITDKFESSKKLNKKLKFELNEYSIFLKRIKKELSSREKETIGFSAPFKILKEV